MNYNWHIVAGWAIFLKPRILPYWMALVFLYSLLVVRLTFAIFKIKKGEYSLLKVSACVSLISFCFFVLQSALSHVFTTLMRFYGPYNGYVRYWEIYGESVFEHSGFFTFSVITYCICAFLIHKANTKFTAKLISDTGINRSEALFRISILTSPLIFFVPLRWFGHILFPYLFPLILR